MATTTEKKPVKKSTTTKKKKVVGGQVRQVTKSIDGVKLVMRTITGGSGKEVLMPENLFAVKKNKSLEAQAVRVYLANQRAGTSATKTRGDVAGSTRKIYRQKGTGKARHGGIRAPIFVGGGIAFGPHPRDYSLTMPQKMRRLALGSSLSSKLKAGDVVVVEDLLNISGKTKEMAEALEKIEAKGKVLLVLTEGMPQVKLAARNLSRVMITNPQSLNTYEVLRKQSIVFAKEAIGQLNEIKE